MEREFDPKLSWNSLDDDCIEDFYKPALKNCKLYQRFSGYFSSSVFAHIATEILEFIESGGRIQLVTSPQLSQNDKEIFEQSVLHREKLCKSIFLEDLKNDPDNLKFEFSKIMGYMLTNQIDGKPQLEIKIAVPVSGAGIFHQKIGILHYENDERIAFSGSINETGQGWYDNKEQFDVYRSWGDDTNNQGISSKQKNFNNLWSGNQRSVKTFDLPEAIRNQLLQVRPKSNEELEETIKKVKSILETKTKKDSSSELISDEKNIEEPKREEEIFKEVIKLRDYQENAREKWLENNFCGLFEMATGTGKTYTAFGCINKLQNLHQRTVTVIAIPQKHLIEQWKKELVKWNDFVSPESERVSFDETITCNSDYRSSANDWEEKFDDIIWNFNELPIGSANYILNHIVIFTTHATLAEEIFSKRVLSLENTKKFLIVDEVHNIGENSSKKTLLDEYDCRLGLSATPTRHMDEIGTGILKDYFHSSTCDAKNVGNADVCGKCGKELILVKLDLRKAVKDLKVLCTYEYYPYYVELTSEEMENYNDLTALVARGEEKKAKGLEPNASEKWAALVRPDIIANAHNKDKLLNTILDVEFNKKLKLALVYCTNQPRPNAPKNEPKQLERVQKILFENGISSDSVTYNDATEIRGEILKLLESTVFGCITAIKCLDEGVDVPAVETGIFMASSNNPKQFVQRRGRILRKNKQTGKTTAKIYDILVSPPIPPEDVHINLQEKKIIAKELLRHKDFADIAENRIDAFFKIKEIADKFGIDLDKLNQKYINQMKN